MLLNKSKRLVKAFLCYDLSTVLPSEIIKKGLGVIPILFILLSFIIRYTDSYLFLVRAFRIKSAGMIKTAIRSATI